MMNQRARDWALPCTHYVDPYGLAVRNRSCAEDLAQLAEHALAQPRIARIARLRSAKVRIGQDRPAVAGDDEPAAADPLPGDDRPEDGLHRPCRPVPGGGGASATATSASW